MILDIDLDAFCCNSSVYNVPENYDGVTNFEQRIGKTINILSYLMKPSLITIARSIGKGGRYVPSNKVDKVQHLLLQGLKKIY